MLLCKPFIRDFWAVIDILRKSADSTLSLYIVSLITWRCNLTNCIVVMFVVV